jgi:hypothetical protein
LDDHHARRLSSGGDISEEAGRSLAWKKWIGHVLGGGFQEGFLF